LKFIRNAGRDRALDRLTAVHAGGLARVATAELSVFGVEAFGDAIGTAGAVRMICSPQDVIAAGLLGDVADRARRNSLAGRNSAERVASWLNQSEVRIASRRLPQSLITVDGANEGVALVGGCALTTDGLGLAPTQPLSLTQLAEREEVDGLIAWFEDQWRSLEGSGGDKERLVSLFTEVGLT